MLQAYIAAPEASHPWLWTHSVRMNEAALNAPDTPQSSTNIETLATWAVWWVRSKSGLPAWDVLYPQVSRPHKFPLPAYPFHLDRIWYKAATKAQDVIQPQVVQAAIQPGKVAQEHSAIHKLLEPLLLSSGIAKAWETCLADSQLGVPASVMSLAYLLDFAVFKNGGPVRLESIVFGPPGDMQDESLVFSDIHTTGRRVIQCLKLGNAQKALIQSELKQAALPGVSSEGSLAEALTADEFIERLEKNGLSLGRALQCIQTVQLGPTQLAMKLSVAGWAAKDGRFWVPILVAMLAGWAYQQQKSSFRLPWQIQSAFFAPQSGQEIETLYLETHQGIASARLMDKVGKPVLQLEGVTLRESLLVQPRCERLEARAA